MEHDFFWFAIYNLKIYYKIQVIYSIFKCYY